MTIPQLPWWVLSIVPVDQPDRLPVLLDRGLLGLYHDWYEPTAVSNHIMSFILDELELRKR